jgi:hypothetical protein
MEAGGGCVISSCSYTWIEDATLNGQKILTNSNAALAAAYVQGGDEQGGLRVFYRDPTSRIIELACEFRGNCWFTSPQILNADKSSSFTAAARNGGGLQVYFVLNGKIAGAIQGSDATDSWTTSELSPFRTCQVFETNGWRIMSTNVSPQYLDRLMLTYHSTRPFLSLS